MVDRMFRPPRPNQVWASDATYIATAEGLVFHCDRGVQYGSTMSLGHCSPTGFTITATMGLLFKSPEYALFCVFRDTRPRVGNAYLQEVIRTIGPNLSRPANGTFRP